MVGTQTGRLPPPERQKLAVTRSRRVGLAELYAEIGNKLSLIPPRDTILRSVLEDILFRLHLLVRAREPSDEEIGELSRAVCGAGEGMSVRAVFHTFLAALDHSFNI